MEAAQVVVPPSADAPVRQSILDAPPPEVPGDVFDRQRVMVAWPQKKVEETTALVLGCGGLGNGVALGLCRLGVRKLILVDMDLVEPSNLNRQVLFTKDAIGKRKVDAARSALELSHNLRSEVETLHINATVEWKEVVSAARRSDVIFNCIDHGSIFDYAVNSLSKVLGIPLILGSSYANTVIVNLFSGKPGRACWSCLNITSESFDWTQSEVEEWMGKSGHTVLGSSELLAFLQEELHMDGPHVQRVLKTSLEEFLKERKEETNSITTQDIRKLLISFVQPHILALLSPEHILSYDDIRFIPKDKNFPTRIVGSWVCVCTGAALLMVNAWVQDMMGEEFPNYCNFTLSTFHATNSKEEGASTHSDPLCIICNAPRITEETKAQGQ
jgi:molybdopterin/thiamine biosynthesis adenylyltransferase